MILYPILLSILAVAAGVWIDTLINNWAVKQLEKDKN